ncbi:hypothetical protein HMPREF9554_01456 [Treponema phagedenis F0421]|uniref:hypothetical protein n=1 Tax=Treponema phagedenis TaxID=162 RepID=UPI0001F63E54|nr:hypothetical protein [Treponema phagedenis]EFW38026.1 hypothetical protein HMPREF9554_01456 [Treponema phagedenis F0421]
MEQAGGFQNGISTEATPQSIALRTDTGTLKAANATENDDLVNFHTLKKEIDSKVSAIPNAENLFILFFQNTPYVQFPGKPEPGTLFSFDGYHWEKANYGGAFFRAEGGAANGFNEGVQAGGIPDAQGWLGFHGNRGGFTGVKGKEGKAGNRGVFQERKRVEDPNNGIVTPINETLINNFKELYLIEDTEFRLSYGGMPIANEVRPVNYTVRLWYLIKD